MRPIAQQSILDDDATQPGVILADSAEQSAHGIAFAVFLVVAVLLDNRFDSQRNDCLLVKMVRHRGNYLVGVLGFAIFDQAVRAADFGGAERSGAVDLQQVVSVGEDERRQSPAALQFIEEVGEAFVQFGGVDVFENRPVLGVGGHRVEAVKVDQALVVTSCVKGQQGGFFEGEHGKGSHEAVDQGVLHRGGSALVFEGLKWLPRPIDQGIGLQELSGSEGGGHGHERDRWERGCSSERLTSVAVMPNPYSPKQRKTLAKLQAQLRLFEARRELLRYGHSWT